jgi:hypothetical protein
MASFNSSTGAAVKVSSAGTDTWTPPFTSSTQLDSYITALQDIITAGGNIKGLNTTDLSAAATALSAGQVNAQSISTSPKLPAVQVWKLPNNSLVVVYVDANGNSSFSYKNDPNNYVQLMPNGSKIVPATSTSSTTPQGQAATSQSSGTPWWVWLLIACVVLMCCGGIIMFLKRRKSSVQPPPKPSSR